MTARNDLRTKRRRAARQRTREERRAAIALAAARLVRLALAAIIREHEQRVLRKLGVVS